jgi:ABC-2 type transport system permease protein
MNKFFRITWQEYSRHVLRKRFMVILFALPLMLAFIVGLVVLIIWMESQPTPIGYIDQSGLLENPISQPVPNWPERMVKMVPYTDPAVAQADLQAGKLQAYYIIPKDYIDSGQLQEIYVNQPKGMAVDQFNSFLTANLLVNVPADIARRLQDGSQLIVQSADKSRAASQEQFVNLILPFVAGILFIIAMSTSSGYLLQAVVEEKENRTMEIMVTSVSPGQLMGGKTIADMAVGATQLVVWGIFILLILIFGKSFFSFLSGITFPVDTILILIAVMVPAFIMISGLMASIGATVTAASEGQQIMGLFTIPIWIPYILVAVFIQNPNSPLAIAMTLFPLTAPMTIAIRLGFTSIPTWQLATSFILLVLSAIGAVWLAGRAFRLGMLRYGQRLRWKEIFSPQQG